MTLRKRLFLPLNRQEKTWKTHDGAEHQVTLVFLIMNINTKKHFYARRNSEGMEVCGGPHPNSKTTGSFQVEKGGFET